MRHSDTCWSQERLSGKVNWEPLATTVQLSDHDSGSDSVECPSTQAEEPPEVDSSPPGKAEAEGPPTT